MENYQCLDPLRWRQRQVTIYPRCYVTTVQLGNRLKSSLFGNPNADKRDKGLRWKQLFYEVHGRDVAGMVDDWQAWWMVRRARGVNLRQTDGQVGKQSVESNHEWTYDPKEDRQLVRRSCRQGWWRDGRQVWLMMDRCVEDFALPSLTSVSLSCCSWRST